MTHRKPRTTCPHTGDVMYDCRCGQCDTPLDATPAIGTVEEKAGYQGEIKVGQRFIWEPRKPKAFAPITVVDVRGDKWIQTRHDVTGEAHWNETDRFREACIPAPPASTTETPK